MADNEELIETVVDLLDRLARQVAAVRNGETTARDDLAAVLHMLVGTGDGFGLLDDTAELLGVPPPTVPSWPEADLPSEMDGLPVAVALRAVVGDGRGVNRALSEFLGETCLRFLVPGGERYADWSWRDLVMIVRHKFGSHADRNPPDWLSEVRFYLAADTDAVSFLMGSVGEAVLSSSTAWLYEHGVDVDVHAPGSRYLGGVDLIQAFFLIEKDSRLDVQAQVRFENLASGRRRPIVGGMFSEEPFIFGIDGDGHLAFMRGDKGTSLFDLDRQFRSIGTAMPPNRKSRRAAAVRERRKPTDR